MRSLGFHVDSESRRCLCPTWLVSFKNTGGWIRRHSWPWSRAPSADTFSWLITNGDNKPPLHNTLGFTLIYQISQSISYISKHVITPAEYMASNKILLYQVPKACNLTKSKDLQGTSRMTVSRLVSGQGWDMYIPCREQSVESLCSPFFYDHDRFIKRIASMDGSFSDPAKGQRNSGFLSNNQRLDGYPGDCGISITMQVEVTWPPMRNDFSAAFKNFWNCIRSRGLNILHLKVAGTSGCGLFDFVAMDDLRSFLETSDGNYVIPPSSKTVIQR